MTTCDNYKNNDWENREDLTIVENDGMHIITYKRIQEFVGKYPDSKSSLENWYRIVKRAKYNSFAQLREHFRSADYVDGLFVFNISGNKYRLIAAIHFNRKKVYIRDILTHQEYDKNKWKRG